MSYPIKLQPVFKEIVWGGNRLKNDYGFKSDLNNIAEAWMLCARNDGDNVVVNTRSSSVQKVRNTKNFLFLLNSSMQNLIYLFRFIPMMNMQRNTKTAMVKQRRGIFLIATKALSLFTASTKI